MTQGQRLRLQRPPLPVTPSFHRCAPRAVQRFSQSRCLHVDIYDEEKTVSLTVSNNHKHAAQRLNLTSCEAPERVAIVGGGFSGAALAIALLRSAEAPLDIIIFERAHKVARGVAYSTPEMTHLLNVSAKRMSALPDEPSHFVRWLARQDVVADCPRAYGPDDYVPRTIYGKYLEATLAHFAQQADPQVSLSNLSAEVVGLEPQPRGWQVQTADGRSVAANVAVLAIGNLPPQRLEPLIPLEGSERYLSNPWQQGVLDAFAPDDDVCVIGSGLTLVDIVMSLEQQGHRGKVTAISRRGLLPRFHLGRPVNKARISLPQDLLANRPNTLATLVRSVRRAVKAHQGPWHEVIDSLRHVTPTLWQDLNEDERHYFLRRYRAFWDVHRSRIAPEVATVVQDWLQRGQLDIKAGKLVSAEVLDQSRLRLCYQTKNAQQQLLANRVINATGPETDLRCSAQTLIQNLLAKGYIAADPTGLGVHIDASGQALNGVHQAPIFVLGGLRRSDGYESIAVPELSAQATALAQQLTPVVARLG